MKINTQDILQELLIPESPCWEISSVEIDESTESIFVSLRYVSEYVTIAGKNFKIYDYRHKRTWRHLDLWQYKTYITAQIPRYIINDKVLSAEVPWAESGERMTNLLEKKR